MANQVEELKSRLKLKDEELSKAIKKNKSLGKENEKLKNRIEQTEILPQIARLQSNLINFTNILLTFIDRDYRYVIVNDKWCEFIGKKRESVIGRKVNEFWGKKEFKEEIKPRFDDSLGGKTIHYQYWLKNAKGEKRYFDITFNPYFNETYVEGVIVTSMDITDRISIEEILRTSELRNRTLLNAIPDMIFRVNRDGTFLDHKSKSGEKLYAPPELFLGKKIEDVLPAELASQCMLELEKAFETQKLNSFEYQMTIAGEYQFYEARVEANSEVDEAIFIIRDITEQKQSEIMRRDITLKIENERKRLQTLVETIPDPMWVKAPDGVYLLCNPAYEMLFGHKASEIIGKTDYEVVPKEVADLFRENDLNAMKENKSITYFEEVKFLNSDRVAFFESTKTPMYDTEGKLIGTLGIARDVTKLIEINKTLENSEAKLKEAQRIAKVGYWELNLLTNHLLWSDEIYNIFEIDPKKFGASYEAFLDGIHPEDREMVNNAYSTSLQSKIPYEIVHRLLMSDGRIKYINEKCVTEYNESGNPIRSIGTVQDITEQEIIANALQESESRYRHLFEQNPAPILIYERGTMNILAVNEAFENHYGYSQEEALSMHLPDLYPEEEKDPITKLAAGLKGYNNVGEWHHRRKDGSFITIIARSNDLVYKEHVARIAVLTDVTDRKIAEEKMKMINIELEKRVSERTAQLENVNRELEAFAYSVSHDLRAPLRHIDGFAKILQNNIPPENDEANKYFKKINDSSTKMASMIDALLAFSRLGKKSLTKSEVNLNVLVNQVIKHFEPDTINRNIEWRISELPVITGDSELLTLVLENLISNAIKFTSKKKKAIIEIAGGDKSGNSCTFYIKDNGAGFSMEYTDKLFGVFQRLHTVGEFEGTGIGLANVKKIINKHGGTIHVEGEVNKGATFYITI